MWQSLSKGHFSPQLVFPIGKLEQDKCVWNDYPLYVMSTVSNSVNSFNSVNSVNNVNSVNSYSAVLPPSPMVFYILYDIYVSSVYCYPDKKFSKHTAHSLRVFQSVLKIGVDPWVDFCTLHWTATTSQHPLFFIRLLIDQSSSVQWRTQKHQDMLWNM